MVSVEYPSDLEAKLQKEIDRYLDSLKVAALPKAARDTMKP